jgi:hypothetical protein
MTVSTRDGVSVREQASPESVRQMYRIEHILPGEAVRHSHSKYGDSIIDLSRRQPGAF